MNSNKYDDTVGKDESDGKGFYDDVSYDDVLYDNDATMDICITKKDGMMDPKTLTKWPMTMEGEGLTTMEGDNGRIVRLILRQWWSVPPRRI